MYAPAAIAVVPDEPTSVPSGWSTNFTAWPALNCSAAPCRATTLEGVLFGSGNSSICTVALDGAGWKTLNASSSAVEYLVPSLTRYQWKPAQLVTDPLLEIGMVHAGARADRQPFYLCRAYDRSFVARVGKSDGSVCLGWDVEEVKHDKEFGFDFLLFE